MEDSVYHIVVYKLKADVSRHDIKRVTDLFYDCYDEIAGITDVSVSHNISPSKYAKDWQLAAILKFKDKTVLEELLQHPAHQKISQIVGSGFQDDLIVFDHLISDRRYPSIWENDPV